MVKIQNPTESESATMDALWKRYEREVIWRGEQFEESHPEVEPKPFMKKVTDWEDWAVLKFQPVLASV